MHYIRDEDIPKIKAEAIKDATRHSDGSDDDLWFFLHSTLIDLVHSQGGKHVSGGDGFVKFDNGEFDVNSAAGYLQIALEARSEFYRDRAENDKSG